jgi:hypothetical protein
MHKCKEKCFKTCLFDEEHFSKRGVGYSIPWVKGESDIHQAAQLREQLSPRVERNFLMKTDEKSWLKEYAVTCRVFKGKWSIRHCLRMYNDIKDLKIQMSSRSKGKVTRHESAYNPCERCKILTNYITMLHEQENHYTNTNESTYEVWAG